MHVIRHDTYQFRAKGRKYVVRSGVIFALRTIWEMLAWRRSYGFACATFGCPVSFTTWLEERERDWVAMDQAERRQTLSEFGNELMAEINSLIPVTPTMAALKRLFCPLSRLWAAVEEADGRRPYDSTQAQRRSSKGVKSSRILSADPMTSPTSGGGP